MGKFRERCDTPEKMAAFRHWCEVPDNVGLRLNGPDDTYQNFAPGYDHIHIPVMAVAEGGVRFPLSMLLCQTLVFYNICPMQCKINMFRVIMGVDRLNTLLGTVLTPSEIRDVYSLVRFGGEGYFTEYYLKLRGHHPPLVTQLPDSAKGADEDFFIVSGDWYIKDAAGNPAVRPPPNRYSIASELPTCSAFRPSLSAC